MPVYPIGIALLYVLGVFVGSLVSSPSLLRPMLVAASVALAVQLIASAVLRDRHKGAYFAGLVLLAVAGNWLAIIALILPLEGYLILTAIRGRQIGPRLWRDVTAVLNVVVVVMIGITAAPAVHDRPARSPGTRTGPSSGGGAWAPGHLRRLARCISSSRHA